MSLALFLYLLFSLLATGGMALIVDAHHSRRAAIVAGVLTFSFFVALAFFVAWVIRQGQGG